jgi:hypothetical protein
MFISKILSGDDIMKGKDIIDLIQEMKLEDEEIYLTSGYTDSGEFMIFAEIEGISKSDEWNGDRCYIKKT